MSFQTLIVNEQPVVAAGIRAACDKSEFHVTAEAHTYEAASAFIQQQPFDLLLIGTRLGNKTGFDICHENWDVISRVPILLVADSGPSSFDVILAIESGARAMIAKSSSVDQLLSSMRDAVAGKLMWNKTEVKRHASQKSRIRLDRPHRLLTERENDVLLEISRGRTNSETADALGIGYETVKDHVANILRKLEVTDRTQAAIWAVRNNVV